MKRHLKLKLLMLFCFWAGLPSAMAPGTNNSRGENVKVPDIYDLPKGVFARVSKCGTRFQVQISSSKNISKWLGTYDTPTEAGAVYRKAAEAKRNGELNEEWIKQHTAKQVCGYRSRNLPTGVSRVGSSTRFASRIQINRQTFRLGTYDTPEEAGKVYRKALEAKRKGEVDEEWIKQQTTKRVNNLPKGVFSRRNRFTSEIRFQRKRYSLGVYDTPAEADSVHKKAESMFKSGGQLDEDWMSQNHNFVLRKAEILLFCSSWD